MKRLIAALCVIVLIVGILALPAFASPYDTTYTNYGKVRLIENKNGLVLGYTPDTGVSILFDVDSGYYFKDLNKNGKLDPYEDWRLDIETRTADLLSQMPLTQKFALMAHSGTNVTTGNRMAVIRSIGKGAQADGSNGNLLQRNAEATAFGIPYSYSSDPVHAGVIDTGSDDDGGGGTGYPPVTNISRWPNTLGLANSFSPELHYAFGQTISLEYRNSQIFQQLGPLIDQSTHPVWSRITNAITEDYDLFIDLVQAEVSGMQTTEEEIVDYGLPEGWGKDSISAMTKHLLGTGSGEFGYEGHAQIGGWLVYPGGGYEKLIDAAADASGFGLFAPHSSKTANAGMTAYGVAVGDDGLGRHNELLGDKRFSLVGGGYSHWLMTTYLREGRNWDGMITSDWGIYGGANTSGTNHGMRNEFGVDDAVRYFVSYMSGMSQTGGTGSVATCQLAYNIGVNGDPTRGIPAYGQDYMDAMVNARAGNVIKTIMKCGLFENPYTDPDKADAENGSVELNTIAFDAHHQSIVMLKNHDDLLPIPIKSAKAYVVGSTGNTGIVEMAGRFYDTTTDPAEADFAIVKITGPSNGNGSDTNPTAQTAQFAPYTKTVGRAVSLGGYWFRPTGTKVPAYEIPNPAAGDYKENMSNIGYSNAGTMVQLNTLINARAAMGDKPVILVLNYRNGIVPAEFEPHCDAIVAGVGVADEAVMNVICGRYEPTGLLAVTFPRSMAHIEMSCEDVPDSTPYVDADGNVYQFGFGLNYSGRIVDERTAKYLGLQAINEVELLGDGTVKVPIELLTYKYGPTGFTATVYYDKADLNLVGFEAAPGFLLVGGSNDRFTFANATAITTNTVIGYAIFEAGTRAWDAKVTFAMDGYAVDIDRNPTMARFNDAEVSQAVLLGDVTLDGKVDVADAVLLLQYLAGNVTLSAKQLRAADVNSDGAVDVSDVVLIMQMCMP